MKRHIVLRISQYKILRSLQDFAYLYFLRIYKKTSLIVTFIEEINILLFKSLIVN